MTYDILRCSTAGALQAGTLKQRRFLDRAALTMAVAGCLGLAGCAPSEDPDAVARNAASGVAERAEDRADSAERLRGATAAGEARATADLKRAEAEEESRQADTNETGEQ
ncbi:hypothetical protein SH591_07085 [Sphingomonas sp. LY54]|uniref:hypothetical protein n=1 Tax=Sphingomonas sp. LY54 TaxID=3095343 RepID=UPI002D78F535|nr:hypothetical protein [Sphingomonas sp. LY54]WRP29934.1 hypothetical protein SH591_07085 [Sphingomonas sp. LY54]